MNIDRIKQLIRDVPDFPKPGIVFKDITPVLANPQAFDFVVDAMCEALRPQGITKLAAIESRGFIFASAMAMKLSCGVVLVRKPGKLPYKTQRQAYQLEYGSDCLEIHQDSFESGESVFIVDDLLATGGTAAATAELCRASGAQLQGMSCFIELSFLEGRKRLEGLSLHSVISF